VCAFLRGGFVGLMVFGYFLGHRFAPNIRQQAILYLQEGFDRKVGLNSLQVCLPHLARDVLQ
jgi:hypothetical protein